MLSIIMPTPDRNPIAPTQVDQTSTGRLFVINILIVTAFLSLTFLLGVFPLKDVDFWWHLKTGDLIRATGEIPKNDLYTFTVPDRPWVDLHWGFQVLLSAGYDVGGVVGLNVAKCVVTTVAILLLITAKRKEWPYWAMVTAWLPALVLLGGRMYIRPETMTLLYLAVFLAILFRWEQYPRLGFLLPIIQVLWVNTQGLFIFGPFLIAVALLAAATRPGALDQSRRSWWKLALIIAVLDGIACLVNPYGIRGAFFPITDLLLGTMSDPIFKETIAELSSIPKFINDSAGYLPFMLKLHLAVATLGGLSFVLPLAWSLSVRINDQRSSRSKKEPEPAEVANHPKKAPKGKGKRKKASQSNKTAADPDKTETTSQFSVDLFRLLIYLTFTALSWTATRNSHQFAAVVGTVTAWNFGEWAAAVRARKLQKTDDLHQSYWPRWLALVGTSALIVFVGSGTLYHVAEEERTVALGEEPAWFPHRAVEFAGDQTGKDRFLGFHVGHNALFLHQFGPEKKVYVDPRLEVMGGAQYRNYIDLRDALDGTAWISKRYGDAGLFNQDVRSRGASEARRAWKSTLDQAGRPAVLVDHAHAARLGLSFMDDPDWVCVWFGPVAAVFLHRSDANAAGLNEVDFLRWHFEGFANPMMLPQSPAEWQASSESLSKYILEFYRGPIIVRTDRAREMTPLGLSHAREAHRQNPKLAEPLAFAAALEMTRDPLLQLAAQSTSPLRRNYNQFDPIADLPGARAIFHARRALERNRDLPTALTSIVEELKARGIDDAVLPFLERSASRAPRSPSQASQQPMIQAQFEELRERLARSPTIDTSNGGQIQKSVAELLRLGRVKQAVELLEAEYPIRQRDDPTALLIARLRLHLGQPLEARASLASINNPTDPVDVDLLLGLTYIVEDDLERAAATFRNLLEGAPEHFEGLYSLALVEYDAGRASGAFEAAKKAMTYAPTTIGRLSAQAIAAVSERFTHSSINLEDVPTSN